jgi:uncharacterized protein
VGNTPLLLAAKFGRNELARVLLDRGALADASNPEGQTPLMVAAMRGNLALARLLLERGANATRMDTHGKTNAVYAGEEGYGELVGLLSQKPQAGADAGRTVGNPRRTPENRNRGGLRGRLQAGSLPHKP